MNKKEWFMLLAALLVCGVVFLVVFFDIGPATPLNQISREGVVVDYRMRPSGKCVNPGITNTNSYPVRIRQVFIYRAEITSDVFLLEPGQRKPLHEFSLEAGLHIFTIDGIEVGWIRMRG